MDQILEFHERACEGFSRVVRQVGWQWEQPSPCPEWNAGAVVEHVIGFHDVLILRPLDAKPQRPKADHAERWRVTVPAIHSALQAVPTERSVEVPGSASIDLARLLPILTTDVLVHTWDLARAVGVDPELDAELCRASYDRVRLNEGRLLSSGMFAAQVQMADDADVASKLIALLGRNPAWTYYP